MNERRWYFRAKLAALGAKNIGIYVGVYFMQEHSINTESSLLFGSLPMEQTLVILKRSQILIWTTISTSTLLRGELQDLNIIWTSI